MSLSLPDTPKHFVNTPKYSEKCAWRCPVIPLRFQVLPVLLSVHPKSPLCTWIPLKLIQSSVGFDHSGILVWQLSNAPLGSQSRTFLSLMLFTLFSVLTTRANWHWDPILITWEVWIISIYEKYLKLLGTVAELCSSGFVTSKELGSVVNHIDTMGDWYHSIS